MKEIYPFLHNRRRAQIDRVLESYVDIDQNKGMYNPGAKISEGQAKAIKQRLRDGDSVTAIATDFQVSLSLVREIKSGRTWKHITV